MRDLTREPWKALPPPLGQVRPASGREFHDVRHTFAGVAFRLRTGIPGRDPPPRVGPWWRAWTLQRRWARLGVWAAPHRAARDARRPDRAEIFLDRTIIRAHQTAAGGGDGQGIGRSRGGLGAKVCAIADDAGRMRSRGLLPGRASDRLGARPAVLAPPSAPGLVVADRGLSAGWRRRWLQGLGRRSAIPARPTHPPVADDRTADRRRSAVLRGWARRKEGRGVASRVDQQAACVAAGLFIASVFDGLKD